MTVKERMAQLDQQMEREEEPRRVEYLLAWECGTWTTEVFDVPERYTPEGYIRRVLNMRHDLWGKGLALIAVYNADAQY